MGHVFLEGEEGCWKPTGALKSFAWMGEGVYHICFHAIAEAS